MAVERAALQFTQGDRMRKAREAADLNSSEMAQRLDVIRNTVTNYEKGHTKPTRATLIAWSMITAAPLDWLDTGFWPDDALDDSELIGRSSLTGWYPPSTYGDAA